MREENSSRKVFLSVLAVAILIVAVVGISYAAFTFTNSGAGDNSINTGTITMSYSEPEAGLSLTSELPMDNNTGRVRTETFDFTVATTVTGRVVIPYEINIVPTFTSENAVCLKSDGTIGAESSYEDCIEGTWTQALANANVRVYLESKTGDNGYAEELAPTLVSELSASSYATRANRAGAFKLLETSDDYTAAAGTTTTNYRLRMWIDANTDVTAWKANTVYRYSLRVNVDSAVEPLS